MSYEEQYPADDLHALCSAAIHELEAEVLDLKKIIIGWQDQAFAISVLRNVGDTNDPRGVIKALAERVHWLEGHLKDLATAPCLWGADPGRPHILTTKAMKALERPE